MVTIQRVGNMFLFVFLRVFFFLMVYFGILCFCIVFLKLLPETTESTEPNRLGSGDRVHPRWPGAGPIHSNNSSNSKVMKVMIMIMILLIIVLLLLLLLIILMIIIIFLLLIITLIIMWPGAGPITSRSTPTTHRPSL